jgi:oxygen-independent coproporphyrinogen III oxidase
MTGAPSAPRHRRPARQTGPGLAVAAAKPPRPLSGIASDAVRHLYVHVPFCAHRCGYCDFVTVVGRRGQHAAYVDAVLAELELERDLLSPQLETVFLGGGTPTFTEPRALERLLGALPSAEEVTVEANPETVTSDLALRLRRCGVNRVSLGAQSFQARLLRALDRVAGPDDVRRAFYHLRDAGFDNISLDLIYGIPGQEPAHLEADIEAALGLAPEHLSYYELEAKPGTRFTHARGAELTRQAEAMEDYFERVVEALGAAGYRWYETSNFCRHPTDVGGRDLRSRHNLAYWRGRDYLGLGIGAVSTVGATRWRNAPKLPAYLGALRAGRRPPRELEPLSPETKRDERVLLGLRLDEPLPLGLVAAGVDASALERLEELGLARRLRGSPSSTGDAVTLTERGRLLGGAVTADLLA